MTMLCLPLEQRDPIEPAPIALPHAFLLWFSTSLAMWAGLVTIIL